MIDIQQHQHRSDISCLLVPLPMVQISVYRVQATKDGDSAYYEPKGHVLAVFECTDGVDKCLL